MHFLWDSLRLLMVMIRMGLVMKQSEKLGTILIAKKYTAINRSRISRSGQYLRFFSVFHDSLALLHGRQLEADERNASILLALCGPLFDDFFDKKRISPEMIMRITRGELLPDATEGEDLHLYAILVNDLLQRIRSREAFIMELEKLCRAQHDGAEKTPSREAILKATWNKGATTAVLSRLVLNIPIKPGEVELLAQLGYLAQITDDLFDWQEDLQANCSSSFLAFETMEELKHHFIKEYIIFKQLLENSDFPRKQRVFFELLNRLALSSFFVAWDWFAPFQPYQYLNGSTVPACPVCDMEKPGSILRLYFRAAAFPGMLQPIEKEMERDR